MELLEPGDLVTWAYAPKDPNCPYADKYIFNRFSAERDPIEDRLFRHESPPYLVAAVKYLATSGNLVDESGNGAYPRMVEVWMTLKPAWNKGKSGHRKLRHFPGKVLTKVPNELVPWLALEYRRLDGRLHLEYKPPPQTY